jgi:hypothetical protein
VDYLVFLNIAGQLQLDGLYALSALNKDFRNRALRNVSYQNLVRKKLFETWAVPLETEYPLKIPDEYPHPLACGDWLRYGWDVFRTPSMCNRRRIFTLIRQLEWQYRFKAKEACYLEVPNSHAMQSYFRALVDQQLLIHRLNEITDFDLFLQVMDLFNEAFSKDLRKPKFRGNELPAAVQATRAMMIKGKIGMAKQDPRAVLAKEILGMIERRIGLSIRERRR